MARLKIKIPLDYYDGFKSILYEFLSSKESNFSKLVDLNSQELLIHNKNFMANLIGLGTNRELILNLNQLSKPNLHIKMHRPGHVKKAVVFCYFFLKWPEDHTEFVKVENDFPILKALYADITRVIKSAFKVQRHNFKLELE